MAISLNSSGVTFPNGMTQTSNTYVSVKDTGVSFPVKVANTRTGWGYRTCGVIMSDGSVRMWGYNASPDHLCGTGPDSERRRYPVNVGFPDTFPGATELVIASRTAAVIDRNGQLWVWGYNNFGQCGTGTTTAQRMPYNASLNASGSIYGKTVTQVMLPYRQAATAQDSIFVICSDGTMHACGYNGYGQLGNGNTTNQSNFVRCGTLTSVTFMDCGADGAITVHAIAGGVLYGWGYNGNGALGDATTTQRTSPVNTNGGSLTGKTVTQTSTGAQWVTWALCSDGTLHKAGNFNGSSNSAWTQQTTAVAGLSAASWDYNRIIIWKTDNTVYYSGYNGAGAQYTGYTYNQYSQVNGYTTVTDPAALGTFVQITTNNTTAVKKVFTNGTGSSVYVTYYILHTDGTLYAHGNNGYSNCGTLGHTTQEAVNTGQIRNGTTSTNPDAVVGGRSEYTSAANIDCNMRVPVDYVEDIAMVGDGTTYGFYVLTKKNQIKYAGAGNDVMSGFRDDSVMATPQPVQFV